MSSTLASEISSAPAKPDPSALPARVRTSSTAHCASEPNANDDMAFIAEHGRLRRPLSHNAFDPYRRKQLDPPIHIALLLRVLALVLIPFRLCIAFVSTLICYIIVKTFGPPVTRESVFAFEATLLPPWRRRIVRVANKILGRCLLLALGFWKIEGCDHPDFDEADAATATIVSNHSSLADPCLLAYLFAPAFIAKSDVYKIPGVGYVGAGQHALYIDRMHGTRVSVAEKIAERQRLVSETKGLIPHVAIFPEGTTTNGDHLLKFRTGAFIAGTPVVPVLIRYTFSWFPPSYESIKTDKYVFGLLSQMANYVEYYRLPVYHPSEAEKADASLYAENVYKVVLEGWQRKFGEELRPSTSNLVDKMEYHSIVRGDKLKAGLKLNEDSNS